MSIRWRIDGTLVCAAMSTLRDDDIYIDDRMHDLLSLTRAIVADKNHKENGLWHWAKL